MQAAYEFVVTCSIFKGKNTVLKSNGDVVVVLWKKLGKHRVGLLVMDVIRH